MSLYNLYVLQSWKLSTVPGVTPIHSCYHISEWGQTSIEYTDLLVRITPMIRSLNFLNRFPWSGLVVKYPAIPFVGHHSIVNSFLFKRYVTNKNCMLMCLVSCYLRPYRSSQAVWSFGCLGRQCSQ